MYRNATEVKINWSIIAATMAELATSHISMSETRHRIRSPNELHYSFRIRLISANWERFTLLGYSW